MPTKNIECQLAQGQIGRYLNGERFSAQAITQLEAHVAECDECSELVTRRREALMTMLGEGATRAAVMTNAGPSSTPEKDGIKTPQRKAIAAEPRSAVPIESAPEPTPSKLKSFAKAMNSKPLLYCGGLAAVLVAMSYFSKDILRPLGPTADASSILKGSSAPAPKVVAPVSAIVAPVAAVVKAPTVVATPTASADSDGETPSLEVAPEAPVRRHVRVRPKIRKKARLVAHRARVRRVRTPKIHRIQRRIRQNDDDDAPTRIRPKVRFHHHVASPAQSAIRVYDADGRSISR
jgi:hypothetical protein